jgi:hypothetical protein
MRQFAFLQFPCFCIYVCNLLEARVIVTTYNHHVRLLSPKPWLVGTTQAYSGVGADIVMESISLKSPAQHLSVIGIYQHPRSVASVSVRPDHVQYLFEIVKTATFP